MVREKFLSKLAHVDGHGGLRSALRALRLDMHMTGNEGIFVGLLGAGDEATIT